MSRSLDVSARLPALSAALEEALKSDQCNTAPIMARLAELLNDSAVVLEDSSAAAPLVTSLSRLLSLGLPRSLGAAKVIRKLILAAASAAYDSTYKQALLGSFVRISACLRGICTCEKAELLLTASDVVICCETFADRLSDKKKDCLVSETVALLESLAPLPGKDRLFINLFSLMSPFLSNSPANVAERALLVALRNIPALPSPSRICVGNFDAVGIAAGVLCKTSIVCASLVLPQALILASHLISVDLPAAVGTQQEKKVLLASKYCMEAVVNSNRALPSAAAVGVAMEAPQCSLSALCGNSLSRLCAGLSEQSQWTSEYAELLRLGKMAFFEPVGKAAEFLPSSLRKEALDTTLAFLNTSHTSSGERALAIVRGCADSIDALLLPEYWEVDPAAVSSALNILTSLPRAILVDVLNSAECLARTLVCFLHHGGSVDAALLVRCDNVDAVFKLSHYLVREGGAEYLPTVLASSLHLLAALARLGPSNSTHAVCVRRVFALMEQIVPTATSSLHQTVAYAVLDLTASLLNFGGGQFGVVYSPAKEVLKEALEEDGIRDGYLCRLQEYEIARELIAWLDEMRESENAEEAAAAKAAFSANQVEKRKTADEGGEATRAAEEAAARPAEHVAEAEPSSGCPAWQLRAPSPPPPPPPPPSPSPPPIIATPAAPPTRAASPLMANSQPPRASLLPQPLLQPSPPPPPPPIIAPSPLLLLQPGAPPPRESLLPPPHMALAVVAPVADETAALRMQLAALRLQLAEERRTARAEELRIKQQLADALRERDAAARQQTEEASCSVCLDAAKDSAMLPCRHRCVCAVCAADLLAMAEPRCPICSATTASYLQLFG